MPIKRLREHLDDRQINYAVITHSPAYTAQKVAASAHISGKNLAKTVIVRTGDDLIMVVLPANHLINLKKLKDFLGTEDVALAREREFKDNFPDCEVGTMPPFGNLYDMQVYVAKELTADKEIAFNAGSYQELIRMKYKDFANLVNPVVGDFSVEGP